MAQGAGQLSVCLGTASPGCPTFPTQSFHLLTTHKPFSHALLFRKIWVDKEQSATHLNQSCRERKTKTIVRDGRQAVANGRTAQQVANGRTAQQEFRGNAYGSTGAGAQLGPRQVRECASHLGKLTSSRTRRVEATLEFIAARDSRLTQSIDPEKRT